MFCSPGELVVLCPVCWCAMCRGRAAEVWFLRGWPSTALTPGYLISPCFVLVFGPRLGAASPATSPAGLHIFYLCSLEKKCLVAMFLSAVM